MKSRAGALERVGQGVCGDSGHAGSLPRRGAGAWSAETTYAPAMAEPSKAVLITGCSSGIGHATALRLARVGLDGLRDRAPPRDDRRSRAGRRAHARARRHRRGVDARSRRDRRGGGGRRRGARSTTPATARAARSRRCRWTPCAASSRPTCSGSSGSPSSCCRRCARSAGARSSTSARWAGASRSRAAAATTPPSTRSRRSRTRCASRSQGFGIDVIADRAGPDHDRVRRGRGERRWPTSRASVDEGPYTSFNAAVGALTKGAYEGPMRRLGGGPDRVAAAIEKRDRRAARAHAGDGHALGEDDARDAQTAHRPRLGRRDAPPVPAARLG